MKKMKHEKKKRKKKMKEEKKQKKMMIMTTMMMMTMMKMMLMMLYLEVTTMITVMHFTSAIESLCTEQGISSEPTVRPAGRRCHTIVWGSVGQVAVSLGYQ